MFGGGRTESEKMNATAKNRTMSNENLMRSNFFRKTLAEYWSSWRVSADTANEKLQHKPH